MLSISNISAHQATTYYEKDNYYARAHDGSDQWQGKLIDKLDLPYEVKPEDFNRLVNERKERAGFDLCFSAPKSVSVAMCTGDENRQAMIEAHNAAVKAVLDQIEQREIGARITKDKVTKHVKTGNMICGKFNHFVSRASDPQLHTHAVILNKTFHNGKWYAVDNPDLYNNKILYGQLYRTVLAQELMKRGYEVAVTDVSKGFFELKNIDQKFIDTFSTRRQEIVEKLKSWGVDTAKAASVATILTRQAKQSKDMSKLMESWKESIKELGEINLQQKTAPILPTVEQRKIAFEDAVRRISQKSFAFTEKQLKRAVLATGVTSGMTEAEYDRLVKEASGKTLVALGTTKDKPDGDYYYTTKKNLEIEKQIFHEFARTKNTMTAIRADKASQFLKAALDREKAPMSDQQFSAVIHIASTKDQYSAVQGLAGTGKTYMLNYTRQVLESEGYTVKGACFTGKAAEGLQNDAKIPSSTIHSFLNRLEREAGNSIPGQDMQNKTEWNLAGLKPAGKEVWVVDEASLVDNNTMRSLMAAAQAKEAKVIFVGDRQQLLPVGIGNAFATMVEKDKISTVMLDEIRRQKDSPELLKAVLEAVKGDINKSLEIINKDTQVIANQKDRMQAIVKEYTSMSPEHQTGTAVLTGSNKDRIALNKVIRAELKKTGVLVPGTEFKVQDANGNTIKREFSPQDKVIFLQNDKRLDVQNNQTGIITKIEGSKLTIKSGEKEVSINLDEYKKIDHAYALTTTKSQGITVDRVLINLDSSQKQLNSRNAYYVDISRARYQVKVFIDNKDKITGQVGEFAKKITSEDFLIQQAQAQQKKTMKQTLDVAMQSAFKALREFRQTHTLPDKNLKKDGMKFKL